MFFFCIHNNRTVPYVENELRSMFHNSTVGFDRVLKEPSRWTPTLEDFLKQVGKKSNKQS